MGDAAKQFELELNKEWAETQEDIGDAITLIVLYGLQMIVQKSPVDTGQFRGNWNVAIGAMNATTTESVDTSGAETIRRGQAVLAGYGKGGNYPVINISNGLPYAIPLEEGHSMQAPGGMVAITKTSIEAKFDGWTV